MTVDDGSFFSARRGVSFRTEELAAFREGVRGLVEDLNGEATLADLEDEVGCTIKLNRGSGEIYAFIRNHVPRIELRARRVRTDQSYLQETARQLDAVNAAVPIKGNPFD